MSQEERKNFTIEVIEKTLDKQGKCCAKCGFPLIYGYVVHHANGDNADVSEDNCQLLHPRCHESEQWVTLVKQRESTLKHIQDTIGAALGPQGMSGASLKEIAGLIDKEISLQNQIYGLEHFDLPAKERILYSEAVARGQLEAYQEGYIDCLKNIPALIEQGVVKKGKQ